MSGRGASRFLFESDGLMMYAAAFAEARVRPKGHAMELPESCQQVAPSWRQPTASCALRQDHDDAVASLVT